MCVWWSRAASSGWRIVDNVVLRNVITERGGWVAGCVEMDGTMNARTDHHTNHRGA